MLLHGLVVNDLVGSGLVSLGIGLMDACVRLLNFGCGWIFCVFVI